MTKVKETTKKSLLGKLDDLFHEEMPNIPTWKAFPLWWLKAHGLINLKTTDGCGDGGFDLIAWPDPEIHSDRRVRVIQSKYMKSTINLAMLKRFRVAKEAIEGEKPEFDNWLKTVSKSKNLKETYINLRKKHNKARFILITAKRVRDDIRETLENENIEVYDSYDIKQYYDFYIGGKTPRVPLLKLLVNGKPLQIDKTANDLIGSGLAA